MAGNDFGGRMSVRLSSGARIPLRGTLAIMGSSVSVETQTNQDGSMDRQFTPVSPEADVTFSDTVNFDDLLLAPRQNIVFTEDNTGVTHHFIRAVFAGRNSNNRINGEVTGLRIVGEVYRKTGG